MYDRVYGIYDLKAQRVTGPLLLMPSDGVAVRTFADIARASSTEVNAHPEDYALFCFGVFEVDRSGRIRFAAVEFPFQEQPIMTAVEVLRGDAAQLQLRSVEERVDAIKAMA